jgi:hypothetical protein
LALNGRDIDARGKEGNMGSKRKRLFMLEAKLQRNL